ncbi:DUF6339 family protein [Nocardia mexicana]|uniref:Ribosome-binding protein aMBF1 (Putative translation factor) n=1 Tax=Nocardia mexicana TaxID=279262 RepID=A0A370GZV9_9NOCA|nr:DUF6339 family protein [Nocardia mexicana]RDI49168.1 ribosome-binding protein aMBF1 (putative translation factor) [Nocardia mexicana]
MSLLFPRLLRARAKDLAAEYRELDLNSLSARWAVTDESAVYVATGGTRVQLDQLATLRRTVLDLAETSGYPTVPSQDQKTSFDLTLAESLHREMHLAPVEAASGDVWAFLALVLMPDVAHWRFPLPPGDRVRGTDLTRHVFGRLWWRAQLVHTPGDPNPYQALTVLGESAFDQIYARRSALGGSPHLIKSILRVWNNLDLSGLADRIVLREFLKRLLRLAPFVVFDGLHDDDLDAELYVVAYETVFGMQTSSGATDAEASERARKATMRFSHRSTQSSAAIEPPAPTFSQWLSSELERADMSRLGLAAKLAVTPAAVSAWVTGRSQPRDLVKREIAVILGGDLPEIFGGDSVNPR